MYEIQTRFINDWENVWHDKGKLQYFDTYQQAYESLNDFIDETEQDLEEAYDIEDFRIVRIK